MRKALHRQSEDLNNSATALFSAQSRVMARLPNLDDDAADLYEDIVCDNTYSRRSRFSAKMDIRGGYVEGDETRSCKVKATMHDSAQQFERPWWYRGKVIFGMGGWPGFLHCMALLILLD